MSGQRCWKSASAPPARRSRQPPSAVARFFGRSLRRQGGRRSMWSPSQASPKNPSRRWLVKARQVCAALFFALLQFVLDQREDDHQGGEEGDYAEAEEGHRFVIGGAGEADALGGKGCGGGEEHQGPDREQGGGEALHGRKSSEPRGVGAAA